MKTAGFTHHVEVAEVMSGMTLHPKFVEAVEAKFTSLPVPISFSFTGGCEAVMCPNDKAQQAEESEIEFEDSIETLAYETMDILVRTLPVNILILHGNELILLKFGLERYFENYLAGDGLEKAYQLAGDHEQDKLESEADHRIDEAKDRKLEESWGK